MLSVNQSPQRLVPAQVRSKLLWAYAPAVHCPKLCRCVLIVKGIFGAAVECCAAADGCLGFELGFSSVTVAL
jgi:hypothetical protein